MPIFWRKIPISIVKSWLFRFKNCQCSNRTHYDYRCVHQIHSILLRTCNFISKTGNFFRLSRSKSLLRILCATYRSGSCSLIWIFTIIQRNKYWASVRPDELRKTLRCFQSARKKRRFSIPEKPILWRAAIAKRTKKCKCWMIVSFVWLHKSREHPLFSIKSTIACIKLDKLNDDYDYTVECFLWISKLISVSNAMI